MQLPTPAPKRRVLRQTAQQMLGRVNPGAVRLAVKDWTNRELKHYADWRVGATQSEMHAHKTDGSVLLTFDDSGTPEQIKTLLQILKRENVKAMFFPRGDWALQHTDLLKTIRRAGHIVGNHSYSHPDMLALSDNQVRDELMRGVQSIWVRPPRGRYNARIRRVADSVGMSLVYWSIDSDDWKGVSASYMSRKILRQLHPGAVILFHMDAPHTPELLPGLIADIRERGFQLCHPNEPDWEPIR